MTVSLVSGRERGRADFDKLLHKMPVHPILVQSVLTVLISRILRAAQDRPTANTGPVTALHLRL